MGSWRDELEEAAAFVERSHFTRLSATMDPKEALTIARESANEFKDREEWAYWFLSLPPWLIVMVRVMTWLMIAAVPVVVGLLTIFCIDQLSFVLPPHEYRKLEFAAVVLGALGFVYYCMVVRDATGLNEIGHQLRIQRRLRWCSKILKG